MNLLLVGFDGSEWDEERRAAEWIAAGTSVELDGHSVVSLLLQPCWRDCFEPLRQILNQAWDAVVLLTVKDCKGLAVERIAINEMDPRLKDLEGRRPMGKTIEARGEPGYWTTLPFRDICERLNAINIQSIASHSAGTGLANYVFYRMMRQLQTQEKSVPAGLIQLGELGAANEQGFAERFLSELIRVLDESVPHPDSLSIDLGRIKADKRDR